MTRDARYTLSTPLLAGLVLLCIGLVCYLIYCVMDRKLEAGISQTKAQETDKSSSSDASFRLSDIGAILRNHEDAYWNKDLSDNAKKTYDNSPHKFVDKWDTPILCIHGEMDYRINANQGMGAFNAAQLRGIPSELLISRDVCPCSFRCLSG